ncbi:TPA_asm: MP [Welwitschia mirabilis associated geminivirus B]|uniref:MP n=1 Tax=Welwitschia mirabilis associated geminivirus B TaxID=2919573 RepID=A0A9N7AB13_9GEMI|nr:TPA_asm: MP [Welwitschia mirabilis associated geminivirus B]
MEPATLVLVLVFALSVGNTAYVVYYVSTYFDKQEERVRGAIDEVLDVLSRELRRDRRCRREGTQREDGAGAVHVAVTERDRQVGERVRGPTAGDEEAF